MYRIVRLVVADQVGLLVFAAIAVTLLWTVLVAALPAHSMYGGVAAWWATLCALSVLNLCAWHLSAATMARRREAVGPDVYLFQKRQLLLSAAYVLGCAFRSILPRADVQRIALYDSWASSVLVGRSVATLAELCFAAQWALLLYALSRAVGSRSGVAIAWLLVPLIVVAEVCSWAAVMTTCYLGNVLEESIWAGSALLLVIGLLTVLPRSRAAYRPLVAAAAVLGIAYVLFMVTVDVPMYASRWLADEACGREYLNLSAGLHDLWTRRQVTFAWEEWRTEIPWMSLYFSVGVWCSIALAHVPGLGRRTDE